MSRNTLILAIVVASVSLATFAQTAAVKPQPAASGSPLDVVLVDGTPIKLRLGSASAASGARVGETLELEVAEEVRVSDVVVVTKGNVADAEVTGLHAGLGSGARLDINLRSVTLSDGRVIPVRSTKDRPNHDDQALVISSASQDASIAPGTTVIAFVNGNQQLDLTRLRAAGGSGQTLKVTSAPPNAEVSVDGHLTGTTPYLFHVPAGEHSVVVRMVGFQPWQRTVHVTTQPINLDAPLVKQDGMEAMPASKSTEASLGDLARAARARKAQQNPSDQSAPTPSNSQNGPRDPMEPPAPKQD